MYFFRLLLDTFASNAFEIWTIFTHTVYFSSSCFLREWNVCRFPIGPLRAFPKKRYNFIECVCNHVYSILYIIICRMLLALNRKEEKTDERKESERKSKNISKNSLAQEEKSIFPREFTFNWLYIYTTISV